MGFLNTTPEDDANLAVMGTGQGEGTNELPKPGLLTDLPGAVGRSIVGGAASAGEALGDLLSSGEAVNPYTGQSSEIATAPGQSFTDLAATGGQRVQGGGPMFDPDTEKAIQKLREEVTQYSKLDPRTTGAFGMTVGPIAKGLTEAGIGSVAGPWGAAALMGGASADETYQGLVAQGVDEKTATEAATAQGVFAGVGAFLPLKYGSTAVKSILGGAGVNLGFGIADREVQAETLKANGYEDMADQVRPFAFQSMLADSILGAAFGTMGHPTEAKPLPSEVDAASAVAAEAHFNDSAPGVATTPEVATLHANTAAEAIDAMANDRNPEPPSPEVAQKLADGIVMDPARMEMARRAAEAIGEIPQARDVMDAPEIPSEPGVPEHARRAADQLATFEQLRQRKLAGETLSPADQQHLEAGYELDRTTAKIGGGDTRVPGVRNMDAFNEMHAQGRLPEHIGMVDADNFKALNDTLNHAEGDRVIELLAHALAKRFGAENVFHKSGDEFVVTGADEGAMREAYHGVNEDLQAHNLVMRRPDGTGVRYKAPRVSAGFAKRGENPQESINEADTALQAEKAAKLARGERHERTGSGGRPADVRGDSSGRGEAGRPAGESDRDRGANGPEEVAAVTGDPVDDATLDGIVAKYGSSTIELPDGRAVTVAQFAEELRQAMAKAEAEAKLHDVAVACFLRTGGAL